MRRNKEKNRSDRWYGLENLLKQKKGSNLDKEKRARGVKTKWVGDFVQAKGTAPMREARCEKHDVWEWRVHSAVNGLSLVGEKIVLVSC